MIIDRLLTARNSLHRHRWSGLTVEVLRDASYDSRAFYTRQDKLLFYFSWICHKCHERYETVGTDAVDERPRP